jgi:hypothetical protein
MIQILVLVLILAAIGCVVAFAVRTLASMGAHPIWANIIYLLVVIALLYYVILTLQSGHLPSVRL